MGQGFSSGPSRLAHYLRRLLNGDHAGDEAHGGGDGSMGDPLANWDPASGRLDLRNRGLSVFPPEVLEHLHLTWISLNQNSIAELPAGIGNLSELAIMRVFSNQLTSLPPEIGNLAKLALLDVGKNRLDSVPSAISQLSSLRELNLQYNLVEELPAEIGALQSLRTLNLYINRLRSLPSELPNCACLETLDVAHNRLNPLPPLLGSIRSLTHLNLIGNDIEALPVELFDLPALQRLDLRCNLLTELPHEIGRLTSLQSLLLRNNLLTELPDEIGHLGLLEDLRAGQNHLTRLPHSIGQLTSLHTLLVYENRLESLPASLARLRRLTELDCSYNLLTDVPDELIELEQLERCSLSRNPLRRLPHALRSMSLLTDLTLLGGGKLGASIEPGSLAACTNVSKLMLSGSGIEGALPSDLAHLTKLVVLDLACNAITSLGSELIGNLTNLLQLNLSHNHLTAVPSELAQLTSLQRLYLSYNTPLATAHWPSGDSFATMGLVELYLGGIGLTQVPEFVYSLSKLKVLCLSANRIASFPTHLSRCTALETLLLGGNEMTHLPPAIGDALSLTELDLSHNGLTVVPDELCLLVHLTDLDLSHNRLQELPPNLRLLDSLLQLRIDHNAITQLPKYTAGVNMPWIGLEGNNYRLRSSKECVHPNMFALKRGSGSGKGNKSSRRRPSTHSLDSVDFDISWASMRGKRPDQQDTLCICPQIGNVAHRHFVGLYDGHSGTDAAEIVASHLHQYVADFLSGSRPGLSDKQLDALLMESFTTMQHELERRHVTDGTAALVVLIDTDARVIHCANAGDSRAILYRRSGDGHDGTVVALSEDHKPENHRERARIRDAGGFVTESKRVNGVLALSRALGDCDLQPLVSYVPDITSQPLGDDVDFVVLGCDGLWDVATNEEAAALVKTTRSAQEAALKLRDHAFMMGSTDNVSVVVIRFDTSPSNSTTSSSSSSSSGASGTVPLVQVDT